MQRIFMLLYSLSVCLFLMNPLNGAHLEEKENTQDDLRVLKLLPGLLCPLAVDFCIPEDFIALSPNGNLSLYDGVFWGPKHVLEAYFENEDSLSMPILKVSFSSSVAQTGPNSFNRDEWKKDTKKIKFIETQWGDYPILALKAKFESQLIYMAWVGLNDPQAGWTLMFNLIYPEIKNRPNKQDLELWQNLLMKTTPLKDGQYFKAYGQDLQDGYTIVNVNGEKLKMLAEKRKSDGMVQVVVIPNNANVKFDYKDMTEGLMGAKWKYGEPIVKVYGEVTIKNEKMDYMAFQVTSIFFKLVDEFTINKEDEKNLLIFQKICE